VEERRPSRRKALILFLATLASGLALLAVSVQGLAALDSDLSNAARRDSRPPAVKGYSPEEGTPAPSANPEPAADHDGRRCRRGGHKPTGTST
jgi:hypothetical protein